MKAATSVLICSKPFPASHLFQTIRFSSVIKQRQSLHLRVSQNNVELGFAAFIAAHCSRQIILLVSIGSECPWDTYADVKNPKDNWMIKLQWALSANYTKEGPEYLKTSMENELNLSLNKDCFCTNQNRYLASWQRTGGFLLLVSFSLEDLWIETSLVYEKRLGTASTRKVPESVLGSPLRWAGLHTLRPPWRISKEVLNDPALQVGAVWKHWIGAKEVSLQ